MNWLFVTFLVAVGAGVVWTRRAAGPPRGRTTRGPVPGYSATPGEEFALDPVPRLERGVDWWPERVEEFHSRGRARIVLRFGVRAQVVDADVRELLQNSAREVSQRTRAHVVYVEAHTDGVLRGVYVWSPDGRGWSGQDPSAEVWYAPAPRAPEVL